MNLNQAVSERKAISCKPSAISGVAGKYQPYPEYKESGVEWLGEIPAHWAIHSLKRTVDGCTNGVWGGEPDELSDITVLRVADFDRNKLEVRDDKLTTRSIPEKDRRNRLLQKGDLLIEKSGGGEKTLVGCVVIFDKDYDAVTSNFVAKMTPRAGFDSVFLKYAFAKLYAGRVNYPSVKQTTGIQNLDSDAYLMERFVFPCEQEQRTIAAFLDHETARIDALTAKQQRLIALLKEKRQAVISHAVTKGLNPNAPMKDSGVEWLGQVPAHWEVSKFGFISMVVRGGSPRPAGDPELFNGDYSPWVTVAEITKDNEIYLTDTESFLTKKGSDQCRIFSSGTLLISNSGATLGVPKILSINANANDGVVGFEKLKINSEFAYFYLSTLTEDLRERVKQGSGQPNLNTDILKGVVIPIPPKSEIEVIVKAIHEKRAKFSSLISKASVAVHLLQERRTALISAAVTGKIDLRDWKAPDAD
ncbi:type I restriction enzyme S subunit [Oceanisphaera litoralis]|uniref:restriction endonuclease subunit S n=1 Tax=Oceanisphaera litoralis TaxID=225144 RepID=UPI001958D681|nr:restriction endonuclease subunit S [Oceanisphaera litoralis]MBM7455269.1 type I restriction enzyme S subunit [Oceanisphaera litoralis]